ncbi:MAG TPA: cytochrome P450 [Sporichthya sp.]|nr:cytochrome P450 [Sporichthya sp.]
MTTAESNPGLIGGRDHFSDFDLDSPEFNENYDEVLDTLLEKCPVAHSKAFGGYWFVSRAEDFRRCASDYETFTTTHGFEPSRSNEEGGLKLYPLELDPPYHTRWRSALGEYFSPRAIRSRTDNIREHTNFLLDELIESGECDFVDKFAAQLPARVFFGSFLGVAFDELTFIQKAVDDAMRGKPEVRPAAWGTVSEWLISYLKQREAEPPRGDFIDAVLTGVVDETGEPCPFEHKLFIMMDMMAGGMGTTSHVLASMVHHLATTPGVRQRIADDPSLRPLYTEEIIRVYAPIVAVGRTATRDVEVAGTQIKAGEFVMLSQAAAAIDPRFVPDPRTVNIDRKAEVNLAFSYGPHRCIGAHIGRLQMNVALDELLRRVHDIEIVETPVYGNSSVARNMDVLKIRYTPGKREY